MWTPRSQSGCGEAGPHTAFQFRRGWSHAPVHLCGEQLSPPVLAPSVCELSLRLPHRLSSVFRKCFGVIHYKTMRQCSSSRVFAPWLPLGLALPMLIVGEGAGCAEGGPGVVMTAARRSGCLSLPLRGVGVWAPWGQSPASSPLPRKATLPPARVGGGLPGAGSSVVCE